MLLNRVLYLPGLFCNCQDCSVYIFKPYVEFELYCHILTYFPVLSAFLFSFYLTLILFPPPWKDCRFHQSQDKGSLRSWLLNIHYKMVLNTGVLKCKKRKYIICINVWDLSLLCAMLCNHPHSSLIVERMTKVFHLDLFLEWLFRLILGIWNVNALWQKDIEIYFYEGCWGLRGDIMSCQSWKCLETFVLSLLKLGLFLIIGDILRVWHLVLWHVNFSKFAVCILRRSFMVNQNLKKA